MTERILLVDDDNTFRTVTSSLLRDAEYDVSVADSAETAQAQLREQVFDLVLTDLKMGGQSGLELLAFVKEHSPDTPVVMATGFASVESAVAAMKSGAEDYLTKPCSTDEVLLKIARVLEQRRTALELRRLREEVIEKYTFENIIGKSEAMRAVFALVRQVAGSEASVLIHGETGTGKELIAKAIHFNSLRKNRPFVSVNCAALSESLLESELFGHEKGAFTGAISQKAGRFEMAEGGTLFLDEVGDIPLTTQVKLLRVLQERQFERVGGTKTIEANIRVISATNKDLQAAIKDGIFREDLFYRLNVMPINLTPLRERAEDIPPLVQSFIEKYAERNRKQITSIAPVAMELLMRAAWPGNVRELENTVERAVILCNSDRIDVSNLLYLNEEPETQLLNKGLQKKMTEEKLTKLYARMILNECSGNKKRACTVLNINYRTLQSRLED